MNWSAHRDLKFEATDSFFHRTRYFCTYSTLMIRTTIFRKDGNKNFLKSPFRKIFQKLQLLPAYHASLPSNPTCSWNYTAQQVRWAHKMYNTITLLWIKFNSIHKMYSIWQKNWISKHLWRYSCINIVEFFIFLFFFVNNKIWKEHKKCTNILAEVRER